MVERAHVIGLTGGSGSGKSFFLEKLRDNYGSDLLAIISQDNYYKEREKQQKDAKGVPNFDLPEAFYMDEFLADLRNLKSGIGVTRREYGYNSDIIVPQVITIEPAPVLVAEGLFLMHDAEIRNELDVTMYISISDALKFKRRILRDRVSRNYPLDDILYRYEHHVIPAYEKYIGPYKSQVNVVINNNEEYEKGIAVIVDYIRGVISGRGAR